MGELAVEAEALAHMLVDWVGNRIASRRTIAGIRAWFSNPRLRVPSDWGVCSRRSRSLAPTGAGVHSTKMGTRPIGTAFPSLAYSSARLGRRRPLAYRVLQGCVRRIGLAETYTQDGALTRFSP